MEAEKLKYLIQKKGIKKNFIARKLNISNAMVTQWVKGLRPIASHHLPELKKILY